MDNIWIWIIKLDGCIVTMDIPTEELVTMVVRF